MKLAEALSERKAVSLKIHEIENRISDVASVVKGTEPAEQPAPLLDDLIGLYEQLRDLTVAINVANAENLLDAAGSLTLLEAQVERNLLRMQSNGYRRLAQAAKPGRRFYGGDNEAISVPTLDVRGLEENADIMAQRARRLDILIQKRDWEIDVDIPDGE